MLEKTTVTTLNFSIIGSTPENIDIIKKAFNEIPLQMVLHKIYTSVKAFITSGEQDEPIDFIATDQNLFASLEQKEQVINEPLIVFTTEPAPVNHVYNIAFDVISFPIANEMLINTINKLVVAKKHFKKIDSINNTNSLIGSDFTKTFLIKRGRDFQPINTDNICIFYTDNKLTFGYDDKGNKFIVQATLIELESQLNARFFFRANRQSLINRKFINKIKQLDEGRYEIIIDAVDALRVDINQQKFSKLREWIENN